jgi:hypothetical protein
MKNFTQGVYTKSASFYCTATCACNITVAGQSKFNATDPYYATLVKFANSTVNNVQGCSNNLDALYSALALTSVFGNNSIATTQA